MFQVKRYFLADGSWTETHSKLRAQKDMKKKIAYQGRIELVGTEPLIWRLIEVPSNYSFWGPKKRWKMAFED